MEPQILFDLKILKLQESATALKVPGERADLSLEFIHSVYHGANGGDGLFWRCGSLLCLCGSLVDASGDGLCLLVDRALRGLEVAADEFEGDFEQRGVEDDLVVGRKLGRVAHPPRSALNSFSQRRAEAEAEGRC